ncbi:MAG TPA: hypothetical protein H9730_02045 [Candidatus Mediterraneibacter stercoripullorum]|nr:hypothetical protein [Candidatus Mediterraneibacter stercoripullorum]
MQVKFYCDLYISECWKNKKRQIMERIKKNKIFPDTYIIALSQGKQNNLEFFQGILLRQHVFANSALFVIGIADGYGEALQIVHDITEKVYQETGDADLRRYIQIRQEEFEETER